MYKTQWDTRYIGSVHSVLRKELNCLGKSKKPGSLYLPSLTPIRVFHTLSECEARPSSDSGPGKPTVKIFVMQVGKFTL